MTVRYTLSIPDELNEWLNQQATASHRSKNLYICHLLQSIRETSEENQRRLSSISIADIFESASAAAYIKQREKDNENG
jgi:hypothetical protein